MITSIHLSNFLSHEDSTLEFHPGVNVLVGPSDSGKTSVLRALRWVAENRPAGDEFRSHWAGKDNPTAVKIEIVDGIITRVKDKTDNLYFVHIRTGEILQGQELKGFGQEVPQPVREVLNLGDINIQYQLDAPFLLGDSPGAVARYLNQIVDLEDIDTALATVSGLKRQNDAAVREKQARLKDLDAIIASFPDLEAAEEYVAYLEALGRDLDKTILTKHILTRLMGEHSVVVNRLKETSLPDGVEDQVASLEEKAGRLAQINYTGELLAGLLEESAEIGDRILGFGDVAVLAARVNQLMSRANGLAKVNADIIRLGMAVQEYHGKAAQVSTLTAIIEQGGMQLLEKLGDQCPLCGNYIPKETS